jgi:GxxExxY protein
MTDEAYVDEEMEPDPGLNRITNAIIGAAIAVHKELGPGHLEAIYGNALELEFQARAIVYVREARFPIMYRGKQVGEGRVDFLVENLVVVELKAVETVPPLFKAQVISYLKVTKRRLALLINFNVRKLVDGIHRIAL